MVNKVLFAATIEDTRIVFFDDFVSSMAPTRLALKRQNSTPTFCTAWINAPMNGS
jgi:hypothetical protein